MSTRTLILKEIKKIPEPLLKEILDYIYFLESKIAKKKRGISIASESSLKKDWMKPEEDEAWKNL